MNALRTMRWWSLAVALLVVLAGCGGGGGGESSDTTTEGSGTDAQFTLTSYAQTPPPASGISSQAQGVSSTAAVDVNGQLLVVNTSTGDEERFTFALRVDSQAIRIDTAVSVDLAPATYNMYFLLEAEGHYYAGSLLNHIIQPTGESETTRNRIPFTLNPVISSGVIDVSDIPELVLFRFRFDTAEIAGYDEPAFSITVTSGAEVSHSIFNINTATGLDSVYVLLPPGRYTFEILFYDGANLKLVAVAEVDLPTEGDLELDVTPIVTKVTYEYTPTSTPETDLGDVSFIVPAVIVNEGGGIQSVQATAAVVGPLTPLVEQNLSLTPSGAEYVGTLSVPGFTAGDLTWSIQFRNASNVLYAYCAQTVTVPESDQFVTETFICEPKLISQASQTAHPPARVVVEVTDGAGVSGAVVTATDEPLGITGEAAGLGPGVLESFLPASSYVFQATHKAVDPTTGNVITRTSDAPVIGLANGDDRSLQLSLTPIEPPPSGEPGLCVDGLAASKTYSPAAWVDGACDVESPLLVTVAESLTVTQGNAGSHWARLYFESLDGGLIVCMYKGNASGRGDGQSYLFHNCYNGDPQSEPPQEAANDLQVGDQLYVDKAIRLRVNGSQQHGPTGVHWTMIAVAADSEGEPPTGGDEPGPEPDGGEEDAPALESILLEAGKTSRPRRFHDGVVYLDGWAKVRIPSNEELTVRGDPERFMMVVHFGRGIKCWYLGGQWNTSVGGFWERFFQHTFNSPACTWGRRAGDTVWTRGPIRARVIMGNPALAETFISTNIDVIRWWEGDDRDRDHEGRQRWGRRWGWRWWN